MNKSPIKAWTATNPTTHSHTLKPAYKFLQQGVLIHTTTTKENAQKGRVTATIHTTQKGVSQQLQNTRKGNARSTMERGKLASKNKIEISQLHGKTSSQQQKPDMHFSQKQQREREREVLLDKNSSKISPTKAQSGQKSLFQSLHLAALY